MDPGMAHRQRAAKAQGTTLIGLKMLETDALRQHGKHLSLPVFTIHSLV
jgi:hypothetical protein